MIIVECGDGLDLFEIRNSVDLLVEIDIDQVLEFMDDVEEVSVVGKLEMPGSRLHLGVQDRALFDLAGDWIEGIYIDMVHTQVCDTQIFVVSGHLDTLYMGAEIALRNASQALQEQLVGDLAHTAVFIDAQDGNLAVVVAAHKEVMICVIRRQMRAAHAVDRGAVQFFQIAAADDLKGFHAEVCDGIQIFAVMRDGHIRGVGDGYLALLGQGSFLHIDIIHADADFLLAGPCVGRDIGDKFVTRYVPVSGEIKFFFLILSHLARPFPSHSAYENKSGHPKVLLKNTLPEPVRKSCLYFNTKHL